MKTLVVLRHAKTERYNIDGDFARVLTERGRRNAREVAMQIGESLEEVDLIVSSPAARARETAEIVGEVLEPPPPITVDDSIYLASVPTLVGAIRAMPDEASTAIMVGHNPGMLDLLSWLGGESWYADHLPTAAYAVASLPIDRWQDVQQGSAQVSAIVRP